MNLRILPLLLAVACAAPRNELPLPPAQEAPVREGLNDSFLTDELDVEAFVERFEGESREVARSHDAILEAIGIQPGMNVADVGAGTGLFLSAFSRAAGPSGKSYAVDISPVFLQHLRFRADNEELTNVEVIQAGERESGLPTQALDRIFICDTYHHFTYPQTTLASLARALRPGGELILVDFERIPGVSREWILGHVRAGKQEVIGELEQAGFQLVEEVELAGLEDNYFLRLRLEG